MAFAAVVLVVLQIPKPRLYQGKSITEWVSLLDPQVGQEKKREEAAWAIVQTGANAVLYLERSRGPAEQLVPLGLKFPKSDDGYTRWAAASLLPGYVNVPEVRSALEQALTDSDSRVRIAAERALQEPPRKPSR